MRDDGEGVEEPPHVADDNTKEESNDREDNKGEMKSSAVYDPQCIYWDDKGNLRLGHSSRDRVEELLQVSKYFCTGIPYLLTSFSSYSLFLSFIIFFFSLFFFFFFLFFIIIIIVLLLLFFFFLSPFGFLAYYGGQCN